MNLSKHFDLAEFTKSQWAARNGVDMTPPDAVVANLLRLCLTVLEPLREAFGQPLIITSGYRPQSVNAAIGGTPQSDHIFGRAADFHVLNLDLASAARIVRARCQTLPISKALMEFGAWIHVAVPPADQPPKRDFYYAMLDNHNQAVYRPWEA